MNVLRRRQSGRVVGAGAGHVGEELDALTASEAETVNSGVNRPPVNGAPDDTGDSLLENEERQPASDSASVPVRHRWPNASWARVVGCVVLPVFALLLTASAAYLKWQTGTVRAADGAGIEAMQAARDTAVALLSYRPDTVEESLGTAQQRLTGQFRENYSKLTTSLVIPTAKKEEITADASVPAAALVSSTPDQAVVLLSIDQTITTKSSPPTQSTWSVRANVTKVDGRWLISAFDPV